MSPRFLEPGDLGLATFSIPVHTAHGPISGPCVLFQGCPMVMRFLLQDWLLQLLHLRNRLNAAACEPDAWWLAIRERILTFLIRRHAAPSANDPTMTPERRAKVEAMPSQRTFCAVDAIEHPPRTRDNLSARLRSVRQVNANKRPRWRWF